MRFKHGAMPQALGNYLTLVFSLTADFGAEAMGAQALK